MTKTLTKGPDVSVLLDRFERLEEALACEIFERENEIMGVLLGLVAGTTVFFHGAPGIAKSFLIDRLDAYIETDDDADYFSILLGRLTDPGELFGPTSLIALREGRFERIIEGSLVTAKFGMVDECFKASSTILNSLLWLINERKYKHGTKVLKNVGPTSLFFASNEFAQDDSLKALYDRFVLRFSLERLQDTESVKKMLMSEPDANPEKIMSWADIEAAQQMARQVVIPPVVIDAMIDVRRKLKDAGIEPSDRKFVKAKQVIRAYAWLDGCDVADQEHLAPLEHMMWEVPEQRADVSRAVLELANPLDQQANELLQELSGLEDDLDNLQGTDDDRYTVGNEIHQKVLRAGVELEGLEERAGGSRKRSKKLKAAGDKVETIIDRVLVEVFNLPPESKPQG